MITTQAYTDYESELESECKDWDYTEMEDAIARISFSDVTMTGSFVYEGQDPAAGFTATGE